MPDDPTLIQRILNGEPELFRELVERHQGALHALVRNLADNPSDQEEIAQDAFVAAFENLRRFDARLGTFGAWLLTIARNRCFNLRKRRRPRGVANVPETGTRAADEEAVDRELWAQLDQALACLPWPQRTAFVLAEILELPHAEVARIEQVEVGTVKSRVSRARRRLRTLLQTLGESP